MEIPTTDPEVRLEVLLARLNELPLAELIVASAEICLPAPLDERGQRRFRQAMAGGQALNKLGSYVFMLRLADQERIRVGREVHSLVSIARASADTDLIASVRADVHATFWSGIQEVTFHYFAICVTAIGKLLPVAASAVGYKIPQEDQRVLNSYIPLRHYFEHLDERLIGKRRQDESVKESLNENEWRIEAGFAIDDKARIIINGQSIDVTSRGLSAIDEILARSYLGLKQSSLDQVRRHFSNHPNLIPAADIALYKPIVSVFTGADD